MILDIIIYPDPALMQVASHVNDINSVRDLAADMLETCKKAQGRGLAATQVGVTKRVLVIDESEAQDGSDLKVYVNPYWERAIGAKLVQDYEGCLSVPGEAHVISRYDSIHVTATTLDGITTERAITGPKAAAWQHEIDHLDGKVYVDYLGAMRRDIIRRNTAKFKRHVARVKAEMKQRARDAAEDAAILTEEI